MVKRGLNKIAYFIGIFLILIIFIFVGLNIDNSKKEMLSPQLSGLEEKMKEIATRNLVFSIDEESAIQYEGYIVEFYEDPILIKNKEAESLVVASVDKKSILEVHKSKIKSQREEFIANSKETAPNIKVERDFQKTFNGVLVKDVSKDEIEELKKHPNVKRITKNYKVEINLLDTPAIINADDVWNLDRNLNVCDCSGADLDSDNDVDQNDFVQFQLCISGSAAPQCQGVDFDNDGDVDSSDQNSFLTCQAGPGIPPITRECLTGRDVAVAVIDTGVDYTHQDLGGCLGQECKVIGGYDFINGDNDPMDDNGHGTHVAATAAGNGVLKGVAPDAKIVAFKVLSESGYGDFAGIISSLEMSIDMDGDGFIYGVDVEENNPEDKVDIISMSLGAVCYTYSSECGPDDPLSRAVDNVVENGVVAVIAAGNCGPEGSSRCYKLGDRTIGSPGTSRKAITVGATNKDDSIAGFSSRGPVEWVGENGASVLIKPDVVAPGASICAAQWGNWLFDRACLDNEHISISGTSMATPHVSGAAALLLQKNPEFSPEMIKAKLKEGSVNLGLNINFQGEGRIDILQSLKSDNEICSLSGDDDGDGLINCADPDCPANSFCSTDFSFSCRQGLCVGPEICNNGIDDNLNGLVDCQEAVTCPSYTLCNGGICGAGQCVAVNFEISSPTSWTNYIDEDQIQVYGSAYGSNFKDYRILYSWSSDPGAPSTWTDISGIINTPVQNGLLGTWNIENLGAGTYTIRLEIRSMNLFTFTKDVKVVIEKDLQPVVFDLIDQSEPWIYGNKVVWHDNFEGYLNEDSDVYVKDLESGEVIQVTNDSNSTLHFGTKISGDIVLWGQLGPPYGTVDIFMCDLSLNGQNGGCLADDEKVMITNENTPYNQEISGDKIVWEEVLDRDGDGAADDIDLKVCDMGLNGQNGGCLADDEKIKIAESDIPQYDPSISGDRIVWTEYENLAGNIYVCDLSLNGQNGGCLADDEQYKITTNLGVGTRSFIDGDRIVWTSYIESIHNWEIFMCDLSLNGQNGGCLPNDQKTRITNNQNLDDGAPMLYGDVLIWMTDDPFFEQGILDPQSLNLDLWMCMFSLNGKNGGCLPNDKKTQITSNSGAQWMHSISGNKIVWIDNRNDFDQWDVYMLEFEIPVFEQCDTPEDDDNDGLINCADIDDCNLGDFCTLGHDMVCNFDRECVATEFCGNNLIDEGEQCDDGNTINNDGCNNFCYLEYSRIFVTNKSYTGLDFGGIVGADEICRSLAESSNLVKRNTRWKAWLSNSTLSASDRLYHSSVNYTNFGKNIAYNWSDLADGSYLRNVIVYDQNNKHIPSSPPVWTGTNYSGERTGKTCGNNWNSFDDGTIGKVNWIDRSWTVHSTTGCYIEARLYCFEQPGEVGYSSPLCGNGFIEIGEQCDDNNTINGDGCNNQCRNEICGNNIVDAGETCDDGNNITEICPYRYSSCMICDSSCIYMQTNETEGYCSDEIVQSQFEEECDDGNLISGDGCDSYCKAEKNYKVFITYNEFVGRLEYGPEYAGVTGTAGADLMCKQQADAAGLNSNKKWKAYLIEYNQNISSRLYNSNLPYKRLDNKIIANNFSDLIDGSIINKINVSEYNSVVGGAKVWTGMKDNNAIDACSLLSTNVKAKIIDLENQGEIVVKEEGNPVYKNQYVVASSNGGGVYKVSSVSNDSSTYFADFIELTNAITGLTIQASIVSEGRGFVMLNGVQHKITYSGASSSPSDTRYIRLTWGSLSNWDNVGSQKETFYCGGIQGNCNNWSSNLNNDLGYVGNYNYVDSKWEKEQAMTCNAIAHLYCVEQPSCGNLIIEPGEDCDDGNVLDGDQCPSNCMIDYSCTYEPIGQCKKCPDLNHDGIVNAFDGNLMVDCIYYGIQSECRSEYDLNDDGIYTIGGDIPCYSNFIGNSTSQISTCCGDCNVDAKIGEYAVGNLTISEVSNSLVNYYDNPNCQ